MFIRRQFIYSMVVMIFRYFHVAFVITLTYRSLTAPTAFLVSFLLSIYPDL